ncbi:hypothetical protein A2U01_0039342, partial [Trifolium medium]|nr:hypothetical protein [Trifolium medium]
EWHGDSKEVDRTTANPGYHRGVWVKGVCPVGREGVYKVSGGSGGRL